MANEAAPESVRIPRTKDKLEWTGERYVSSLGGEIQVEHHHRYLFAVQWCRDKDVLDIACGEGYGSLILASAARSVVGMDIASDAVRFASRNYRSDNLRFAQAECVAIPLGDASVDVVVSFETIEHIAGQPEFITEIKRILRPDGLLICSTPNIETFKTGRPRNDFHVCELSRGEFNDLLRRNFRYSELCAQQLFCGSVIRAVDGAANSQRSGQVIYGDGREYVFDRSMTAAPFLISLSSDVQLPSGGTSVLGHRHYSIGSQDTLQRSEDSREALAGARRQLEELRSRQESQTETLEDLNSRLERVEKSMELTHATVSEGLVVAYSMMARAQSELAAQKKSLVLRASGAAILAGKWLVSPHRKYVRERATIRRSGLFDDGYYLDNNPDVAKAGISPLLHFVLRGWREGRKPNPYFDPTFYLKENGHVRRAEINPLLHYIERGSFEGLSPCPQFDGKAYLLRHPALVFKGENALGHLLRDSSSEGADKKKTPDCDPQPAVVVESSSSRIPEVQVDEAQATRTRLIAFYLPQYHPCRENDDWWGKGFTEWTNVTRAKPAFPGHKQPLRPSELGYYDLRVPEVRAQQADLAQRYGIHGFCYYYYWFGGRRLLDRPLKEVLESKEPKFPFCICWANEDWTRAWDGRTGQILVEQKHCLATDAAFIREVAPLLKDPRYIRVDGKALLIVYRPELMQCPRESAAVWRDICHQEGVGEIQLAMVQFRKNDPRKFGFDAAIEFPPHYFPAPDITKDLTGIRDDFQGSVFDYATGVKHLIQEPPRPDHAFYRGVMPGWDNTGRRGTAARIFHGTTPDIYEKWLRSAINHRQPDGKENLVFINAWNEWAEGACLEPEETRGRSYLEATLRAIRPGDKAAEIPEKGGESFDSGQTCEVSRTELAGRGIAAGLKRVVRRSHALTLLAHRYPRISRGVLRMIERARSPSSDAHGNSSDPRCSIGELPSDGTSRDYRVRWRRRPGGDLSEDVPKIVFISHDAARAGAQLVLCDLMRELSAEGTFEPYVVLLEGGALEDEFYEVANGVNLQDLAADFRQMRSALWAIGGCIRQLGPEVVICNTVASSEMAEVLTKCGLRVLSLVHELVTSLDASYGRDRFCQILKFSEHVGVVSEFCLNAFQNAFDIPDGKLSVVNPGVPIDTDKEDRPSAARAFRKRWKVPEASQIVLGCGSVHMRKGADQFVHLAAEYGRLTGDSSARFVWVGSGPPEFRQWCHHDRVALGVEKMVLFTGEIQRQQVRQAYLAAEVFALTSREDPFPLVALEAMDCALPVLAFNGAGGSPEAIRDDAGIVVPYMDISAMARAVADLLGDGKRRRALGEVGRERVRRCFSTTAYAQRVCALLKERFGIDIQCRTESHA